MLGRWIVGLGGFVAAIAVVAWLRAEARVPAESPIRPEPGRYYALQLSGASRAFDLEMDGISRYELIVSSLGDAARTFPVRLEVRHRERAEQFPAIPVAPLVPRNIALALPPHFPAVEQVQAVAGAPERRFFLHVSAGKLEDEQGYVPVTGNLAAEGDRVRVYFDRHTPPSEPAPGLIEEIIRLL
ncbi:MAG: hypothetical protein ACM3U2_24450, partial [Deltaproteobacteria bacterium]